MGRGIALQFKKRFPDNFFYYEIACKEKKVIPGKMLVFKTNSLLSPKYIINFPTKRHWRNGSRIEDIESGLQDLVKVIKSHNIKSIAIPPLGCGLGGLDWNDVRSRIENALKSLSEISIFVFEPKGTPKAKNMVKTPKLPNMTPGRAALIELVHRYLSGLLDPFVSLLEIHKMMYFLQESGEPLRLNYKKGHYGPYAENLRHVLNAIEGHYLSGYADGGDKPDKELELIPEAFDKASTFLETHLETKQHLDKVFELVEGFESPYGLELLSTVHWVVTKEKVISIEQVISNVHQWNDRKKRFTPRQIELTYNILAQKDWF